MRALPCFTAICLAAGIGSSVSAHEVVHKGIKLVHPWLREAPRGAEAVPVHVKITNTGKVADRLVGASLKGAEGADLYAAAKGEGAGEPVSPVAAIPIAPGETLELTPDGTRVVFRRLTTSLDADQYVDGSLTFEKAGKMAVEFYVEALSEPKPQPAGP